MRLLVWASSFGHTIGGGPVLGPLLCSALSDRGHEVVVVTDHRPPSLPAEEKYGSVRVVRLPFRRALSGEARLFVSLRREITALKRSYRPDLTHIFSPGYSELFHHLTAQSAPVPLVVTLHDSFRPESFHPDAIIGRDVRAASWITACSEHVLRNALRHVPTIAERSTAILNALPEPRVAALRDFPKGPELLYVGRLVYKKGVDVLINAVRRLVGNHPTLRLTILGEGEAEASLMDLAQRLGIAGHIVFAGAHERTEVFKQMAASTVIVVPSRVEPFGLVTLEAALVGRPVVASRVDGLPEVVLNHHTGLLVPPEDEDALAAAIASLLESPQECRRLGHNARQRAVSVFSWEDFVSSFERLFETLVRQ